MNALTLHAMDDSLAFALRKHAAELGTSINQAAKALLAGALGLSSSSKRPEAAKMRSFVEDASFSRVDKADWK